MARWDQLPESNLKTDFAIPRDRLVISKKITLYGIDDTLERRLETEVDSREQKGYKEYREHQTTVYPVECLTAHEEHKKRHHQRKHQSRLENIDKECSHGKGWAKSYLS